MMVATLICKTILVCNPATSSGIWFPNPCKDNWLLKTTITVIGRLLSQPTRRMLWHWCSWYHSNQYWIISLIRCFGWHLLCCSLEPSRNPTSSLTSWTPDCCGIRWIHTSNNEMVKNHQFNRYSLDFERINHPLCPVVVAVRLAFHRFTPCESPAFVTDENGIPITGLITSTDSSRILSRCVA